MPDRLKNCLFDLPNPQQWIFLQLFNGEDLINILTEIHPLDSLLSSSISINMVNLQKLLELFISQIDVQSIQDPSELQASDDVLPQAIKVQEKFSDPHSLKGNLSLDSLQNLFDRFGPIRQSLLDIELFSQ